MTRKVQAMDGNATTSGELFWQRLDDLIAHHRITLDRPKGSAHPRYPAFIYPLDYGYLEGTSGGDGDAIDLWIGSEGNERVTGLICTVDAEERDLEIKLLIGCSAQEMQQIAEIHNQGLQSGVLIPRKP